MRCARLEDRRAGQDAAAARRSEGRSRPRAVAAREGAALGGSSLTRCRGSQTSPGAAPSAANAHEAHRHWSRRAVVLLEAFPRSLLSAALSSTGCGSPRSAARQTIVGGRQGVMLEGRERVVLVVSVEQGKGIVFLFFIYFLLYRGENQNSRIAPGGDTKDGPPSPSAFTAYIYLDALFSVPPPGGHDRNCYADRFIYCMEYCYPDRARKT